MSTLFSSIDTADIDDPFSNQWDGSCAFLQLTKWTSAGAKGGVKFGQFPFPSEAPTLQSFMLLIVIQGVHLRKIWDLVEEEGREERSIIWMEIYPYSLGWIHPRFWVCLCELETYRVFRLRNFPVGTYCVIWIHKKLYLVHMTIHTQLIQPIDLRKAEILTDNCLIFSLKCN